MKWNIKWLCVAAVGFAASVQVSVTCGQEIRLEECAPTRINLNDKQAVVTWLTANIKYDNKIIGLYRQVDSWESLRNYYDLYQIPQDSYVWMHLADARTKLVTQLYSDVRSHIYKQSGIYLDDPKNTTHFIGTPPGDPKFKGMFSDLDLAMRLGEREMKTIPLPDRQMIQIAAKRRMEEELAKFGPDSGFLLDTNIYTTPEMFDAKDVGPQGVHELEQYDDVLAYLAIRIGCGSELDIWLDLKQRLLNRTREHKLTLEPRVQAMLKAAEDKYDEVEQLRKAAIDKATAEGRKVYPGLDEQAVTRHFEDKMLAFIRENRAELSNQGPKGEAARVAYNRHKADYEASLRESYFTFAAQTFIVRWGEQTESQKQQFLSDPNSVRRVRADQARFILHYLHLMYQPVLGVDGRPPSAAVVKAEKLRRMQNALQKVAKYEQRAMNVQRQAKGKLNLPLGFTETELFAMFDQMKGMSTPEGAWEVWKTTNYHRLNDPSKDPHEYAIARAEQYFDHVKEEIRLIVTEIPVYVGR